MVKLRRRLPLLVPLVAVFAAHGHAQAATASSAPGSGNSSASYKLGYFGSSKRQQDVQQPAMALMGGPASYLPITGLSQTTSYAPPSECFNCLLPSFTCTQFGQCNEYDGQCICPDGFGGLDCSKPLDGSLADGKERYPREGNEAHCKEGWTGLNCNVCQTDDVCRPLIPDDEPSIRPSDISSASSEQSSAVCYKGGLVVDQMHQMCDVTNRKILDMLPDRPPQVTFSCDRPHKTCSFQFWVGGIESFYCGLEQCEVKAEATKSANVTKYDCQTIKCACIPGRMLCGENGSVNIDDFLAEEIKGPGTFSCNTDGTGCSFVEPAMNQLINDVFGDDHITLNCNSGECMHYTMVPGFESPAPPDNTKLLAFSIAVAGAAVIAACLLFWFLGRQRKSDYGRISLTDDDEDGDEFSKLLSKHVPATLQFTNLGYNAPSGKQILSGVSGSVKPGQLLAIMGASGAGKSTLLDILARKAKSGAVTGKVTINGQQLSGDMYKRIVGFVDQEDTLLSTLTVYETILYSALLRLPRDMSHEAKKMRTLETMHELGIMHIKDSRIGESGRRSISGGEKRRVSIACELVTSPSILFLDEPTSGLDAYNAVNVVECLVNLAEKYNRTVVFTIHQPRSNIVSLFDHLLLLAEGRVVYSGEYRQCQTFFESIGHPCPPGYNIADFLIDLTMQDDRSIAEPPALRSDEEQAALSSPRTATTASPTTPSRSVGGNQLAMKKSTSTSASAHGLHLSSLIEAYEQSDIAKEISGSLAANSDALSQSQLDTLGAIKRASIWSQFRILSGRSFKNLYRNPMLMLTHYVVSVVLGVMCGFLFAHVTEDIPGFQNRMGLFFFILAVFGFSCLTSLDVFAKERILFMRERSNGYYSPAAYFTAKVLFDILPLRVIPPFILGAIIYSPVGLVAEVATFWKFILVLIMFNLSASSVVLFISVVVSNSGIANLAGSLIMLLNLLFAGLLINREKLPRGIGWLQTVSFFHAAFESLLVNEVRYLQLRDHKYGVDIEVPAATILSLFGFRAQAFWWPDFLILCIYFGGFVTLSFVALVVLVKERR